jgi:CBS domain-containing protein
MTDKLVQPRLVVEHKELVGVISLGDILEAIIDDQQFIIEQLEH